MSSSSEYQGSIALFATTVEGALDNLEKSKHCLLRSHVHLLKVAVSFAAFCLEKKNSTNIDPKGVFNLDAELHIINNLTSSISIDDKNFRDDDNSAQENALVQALRTLKVILELAKYKNELKASILKIIHITNSLGLLGPSFKLPATMDPKTLNEVLSNFLKITLTEEDFSANEFQQGLTYDKADQNDALLIPKIGTEAIQIVLKSCARLGENPFFKEQMNILSNIVSSSKKAVNLLTKGGLKTSTDLLKYLDEELIYSLYDKEAYKPLVQPDGETLGEGLMGIVRAGKFGLETVAYKAVDLKIVNELSADARNELISEIRLLWMKFNNEHILRLLGVAVKDGRLYIGLQKLHASLAYYDSRPGGNGLPPDTLIAICLRICKGLKFLHSKLIIHGSLQPANVLLAGMKDNGEMGDRFTVKLTDFGMLKTKKDLVDQIKLPTIKEKERKLRVYAAPEVLGEKKYSTASDMYSFSMVAWEIGQDGLQPFMKVDDLNATVIKRKERPNINEAGRLKFWLKDLVQKCWAHEPWKRPNAMIATNFIQREIGKALAAQNAPKVYAPRDPTQRQSAEKVIGGLAMKMKPKNRASQRSTGTRLSQKRTSMIPNKIRQSSNIRTSVVALQKHKYAFLDLIGPKSETTVGIKIVKVMRAHPMDAALQQKCIIGLRKLLKEDLEEVMMRMGAAHATIEAIRNNRKEGALLELAFGFLANLAVAIEISEAMLKMCVTHEIITAMKNFKSDSAVLRECLMLVTNLHQSEPEKMTYLVTTDLPGMIMSVLDLFPNDGDLHKETCATIAYLALGFYQGEEPDEKMVKRLKNAKGEEKRVDFFERKAHLKIEAIIKTNMNHPGLVCEGFNALRMLVLGIDRRKKPLAGRPTIELVKEAFVKHGSDPTVAESCLIFLSLIGSVRETQNHILETGVYKNVVKALEEFTDEEDMNMHSTGLNFFKRFANQNAKTSKALYEAQALTAISRMKLLYPENEELLKRAIAINRFVIRKGRAG